MRTTTTKETRIISFEVTPSWWIEDRYHMWESKLQIWANHYYCSVSCQLLPGSNYWPVSLRGISWINGSDLWELNFSTAKRKLLAVIQLIPSRLSGNCVLVYVAPRTGAIVKMAMSCAYADLCTQSLFDMNVVITSKWPCNRESFSFRLLQQWHLCDFLRPSYSLRYERWRLKVSNF